MILLGEWSGRHGSSQASDMTVSSPLAKARSSPPTIPRTLQSLGNPAIIRNRHVPPHNSEVEDSSQSCIAQSIVGNEGHGLNKSAGSYIGNETGYLRQAAGRQSSIASQTSSKMLTKDGSHLSLEDFLHATAAERLHSMPHRASRWDKTIRQIEGNGPIALLPPRNTDMP